MLNNRMFGNPALRGAAYYAIFYGAVGSYFAYLNVVYIQRGLSGVQIGILNAVSSIVILFSSPLFSGLADRKGWHRQILFLSHLFFGVSILALHFTQNFYLMLVIIGLGSFFTGPLTPLSDMMIVKMANKYELDFGHMRIWGSLGFFVVCTIMGRVWDAIGLDNLFLVAGVLFSLRAFSAWLIEPLGKINDENEEGFIQQNAVHSLLKDRHFLLFLLGCLLWSNCWNTFFAYSSIYMDQLGGTSLLVGMMMSLAALGEVPSGFLADRFLRRFGHFRVFVVSIFLFLVVMIAVTQIKDPVTMVIMNGLRGVGFGFFIVGGIRYVDQYAPKAITGTYQSFYSIITFTIPNLIAMPLMGYLFDNFSIQIVFRAEILMGILAMLIFMLMFFQEKQKKEKARI